MILLVPRRGRGICFFRAGSYKLEIHLGGGKKLGDTKINCDDGFGINTFRREICSALGEVFWEALTDDMTLPDIETEGNCQCGNMCIFSRRRKAAIALSSKALEGVFGRGVEMVTLSGSSQAVPMYKKLGFHTCFHNIIMVYE